MDSNEFLEHYGVKGMKWGVRRDKKRSAKLNAKAEARAEKRGIKVETAKRQIRQQRAAQKEAAVLVAKGAATTVAYGVGKRLVADVVLLGGSPSMTGKSWQGNEAATTKLIQKGTKLGAKGFRAAVKGAKMVFSEKTGNLTYIPPGGYMPGSNPSAGPRALSVARKALNP